MRDQILHRDPHQKTEDSVLGCLGEKKEDVGFIKKKKKGKDKVHVR